MLVVLALVAAACSGGSGGGSTAASTTKPKPKPKYTIAKSGTPLKLGDITVRVVSVSWPKGVSVGVAIPGLDKYAVVKLAVTNTGTEPGKIAATQFWLLDAARQEYLASLKNNVSHKLIGLDVAEGATVTGNLVFPTPRKFTTGSVLTYQFKDALAIAKATQIGLAQFG